MKKIITILTAVVMAVTSGFAQGVTGKVVEENHSPLEFVNVVLLNPDTTYMAGTVTDEKGIFMFNNLVGDTFS